MKYGCTYGYIIAGCVGSVYFNPPPTQNWLVFFITEFSLLICDCEFVEMQLILINELFIMQILVKRGGLMSRQRCFSVYKDSIDFQENLQDLTLCFLYVYMNYKPEM